MFGFFGKNVAKNAAKCGARCVPGLNAVIIAAEVASAVWAIYKVGKNVSDEGNSYRRG